MCSRKIHANTLPRAAPLLFTALVGLAESPGNAPAWPADYFTLEPRKAPQTQGEVLPPFLRVSV